MRRLFQLFTLAVAMCFAASAWAQADKAGPPAKGAKKAKEPKALKVKPDKAKPAKGKPDKAKPAKGKADKEKPAKEPKKPHAKPGDTAGAPPMPPGKVKKLEGPEKRAHIKDRAKKRRDARAQRKKAGRDKMRKALKATLKGKPMSAAFKQELKRHARRLARLERILELAAEAEDDESLERAEKLLAKENARHGKWMQKHAANPGKGAQK
jgi:hypothetical protein